jgi:hypothetical protein
VPVIGFSHQSSAKMPNKPPPAVVSLLAACLDCSAQALWMMWPVLALDARLAGQGFGDVYATSGASPPLR